MPSIRIENLTKSFNNRIVIDDLSLEIEDGDLFVVVGPNGSGKTTLLRLIAGTIKPDEGRIYFDEKIVNNQEPRERGVRMVFEDYALYPHMKVYDEEKSSNLSLALKIQGFVKKKIRSILKRVTERLGIADELFDKKPDQLSAGEKQKVAVGRAVTLPPEIFLMDEPLKNLDPQSKRKARSELLEIHEDLKTTTVYVTCNLLDAVQIADKICVIKDGAVQQVDTPNEILNNPKNEFVSDFFEYYRTSIQQVLEGD